MDKQKQMLDDLFPGWEPVEIEESEEINFDKPIKGRYNAKIVEIKKRDVNTKNGEKTIVGFKLQVVEDVSGESSNNRFLYKDFWMGESQYDQESGEEAGIKAMINNLHTARLDYLITSKSDYEIVASNLNDSLKDKVLTVRTYPGKNINEKTGEKYQTVIFCKPAEKEEELVAGNPYV